MNGSAQTGMYDDFKERECGAYRIRSQGERRGGCEKTIHYVVWVRCEANEEQKFRSFFDRANHTSNGWGRGKPSRDAITEEQAREDKYS